MLLHVHCAVRAPIRAWLLVCALSRAAASDSIYLALVLCAVYNIPTTTALALLLLLLLPGVT